MSERYSLGDRPLSTTRPVPQVNIRNDASGSGLYRAPRRGVAPDGTAARREHQGIDILAPFGTTVASPFDGTIDIKNAYKDPNKSEFKIVSVTSQRGQRYRFFYVAPSDSDGTALVSDGDGVAAGQAIGTVQNIAKIDRNKSMHNHIHFEIWEKNAAIDPTPQIDEWRHTGD